MKIYVNNLDVSRCHTAFRAYGDHELHVDGASITNCVNAFDLYESNTKPKARTAKTQNPSKKLFKSRRFSRWLAGVATNAVGGALGNLGTNLTV